MLNRIFSWKLIAILGIAAACFTFWVCFKPERYRYEARNAGSNNITIFYRIDTETGTVDVLPRK